MFRNMGRVASFIVRFIPIDQCVVQIHRFAPSASRCILIQFFRRYNAQKSRPQLHVAGGLHFHQINHYHPP
jgi:hypothetical protein